MAKGECNCGAVQFEIDADLSGVSCATADRRRSTGSNGIAVVSLPNDRLRWIRGEEHIATWRKPKTDWETWIWRMRQAHRSQVAKAPGHTNAHAPSEEIASRTS